MSSNQCMKKERGRGLRTRGGTGVLACGTLVDFDKDYYLFDHICLAPCHSIPPSFHSVYRLLPRYTAVICTLP